MHSGVDGVCLGERDSGGPEFGLGDVGTAVVGFVLAVWGRWLLGSFYWGCGFLFGYLDSFHFSLVVLGRLKYKKN